MGTSKRTLTLKRGVGLTQTITWRPGGVGLDLTGHTLYMQVRESEDRDSELYLQISSLGLAGESRIEFDADQATNTGRFTIIINANDSIEFGADRGVFDLVLVDGVGSRATIGSGWRLVVDEVVTVVEDYS